MKEGRKEGRNELVGQHFVPMVTNENSTVLDSIFRMLYMSTETCKSPR